MKTISLSFVLLLTLLYSSHNYLATLYQKELRLHAELSKTYHAQLHEEQILRYRLEPTSIPRANPTSPTSLDSIIEGRPGFKETWKKIALREIPLVHVALTGDDADKSTTADGQ